MSGGGPGPGTPCPGRRDRVEKRPMSHGAQGVLPTPHAESGAGVGGTGPVHPAQAVQLRKAPNVSGCFATRWQHRNDFP